MDAIKFPKISIVTTCYNHGNFIAETIESILSQKYPNLEYIVYDDGSTDNSWEIISQYIDQLSCAERLTGYRDTPVITLNKGFEKTTGEILMWLNSDDVLLPNSLFVIAKIFTEHPEVEWMTGMATTINKRSEIINSKLRLKHLYDFLVGNWKIIQQESTFFRRSLWNKSGGKLIEDQKWAFDTELWTRFFQHTEHYHAATPIGAFRKGEQSKTVKDIMAFLEPSEIYLKELKQAVPLKEKTLAYLYRLCRLFRFAFTNIPNKIFCHVPILSKYCYKIFEYSSSEDSWILKRHNPFR